ncbi:hypothetical protein GGQ68_003608 [Sagittula marina]|uniref:Uncharacterized protein n=1 Tax=Sagittula marina TaxID=943940 RepID=A0A7W6DQT9_9RHOB|nr:hypothetical protein [Sagittula marina]
MVLSPARLTPPAFSVRAITAGFRNRTFPHRPARRSVNGDHGDSAARQDEVSQLLKSLQSDDLVTIANYDMDRREKRIGLEKARERRPDGRKSRP